MTNQPRIDEAGVVALLQAAAEGASWPATPDLRAAVVPRITGPEAPDLRPRVVDRIGRGTGARPRSTGSLRLLRPLALAGVLVVAVAGLVAGLGFRLPGFELERVDRTPPAGAGLALGSPVPLAEALTAGEPDVRLPSALPRPDTAYVVGAGDRRIVTVAWRAEPGQPTITGRDLALTLLAVAGSADEKLLRKTAGPGTTVEAVRVGDDPGWWISGAPHEVLILRPDASIEVLPPATAGDTLVFARDGTLYRLESSLGRDATVEIARSMP